MAVIRTSGNVWRVMVDGRMWKWETIRHFMVLAVRERVVFVWKFA